MKQRHSRLFACDFETTVYKGQVHTEVWAAACVELYTEDVHIFNCIDDFFNFFRGLKCNIIMWFHNLKFDGSFILPYYLVEKGYTQASIKTGDEPNNVTWVKQKNMISKTIRYSISDKGQWYNIIVKENKHFFEIRDSLKLLPFSLAEIGESFKTKHQKLEMEYEGFRYAGCDIKDNERVYISNDVLVLKEGLEIMLDGGNDKLTIGSCCLSSYKSQYMPAPYEFNELFPNQFNVPIDSKIHKYKTVGDWVRKSYKGGWCYLVKGKERKIYKNGTTADVNSLYSSMMHSKSGNRYPVGNPVFWCGNYVPNDALINNRYFFVRVKTRFYLKPGKLPFIQIKSSLLYKGTECLESSDVYDKKTGKYYTEYIGENGEICNTRVEMTLTMTDYYLFLEHYNVVDFEILDGCYYNTMIGIFDDYINYWGEIKMKSKGSKRQLAKLYLNNLYGKFASSEDSSFKYAYVKDDGSIGFLSVTEYGKEPGYIPIGSAITSYARNFTIRAAQKNYYGRNTRGFIYADTDSIHCDLHYTQIRGIDVHPTEFCCWKLESCWSDAIFTRQKTYIERVTHENLKVLDEPYLDIKCAGMPQRCKDLLESSMTGVYKKEWCEYTEEEQEFLSEKRTMTDFDIGLCVPGKLIPKRIRGGVILNETTYEMR